MIIHAHILAYNEQRTLPYALRHYQTFCDLIVVHDLGSTDATLTIAREAGVHIVNHDGAQEFDDLQNARIKKTCWLHLKSDWAMCLDTDELIYFPEGARETLAAYDRAGVPVVRPHGWEMFSDVFPTTNGQLYDEIKMGARDDRWYGKPVLFSPNRVASMQFGAGAHNVTATSSSGETIQIDHTCEHISPPTYLLHCHHLGPIEEIAARYDMMRERMSAINKRQNFGWHGDGMVHAKEKREMILANLEQVIGTEADTDVLQEAARRRSHGAMARQAEARQEVGGGESSNLSRPDVAPTNPKSAIQNRK